MTYSKLLATMKNHALMIAKCALLSTISPIPKICMSGSMYLIHIGRSVDQTRSNHTFWSAPSFVYDYFPDSFSPLKGFGYHIYHLLLVWFHSVQLINQYFVGRIHHKVYQCFFASDTSGEISPYPNIRLKHFRILLHQFLAELWCIRRVLNFMLWK